VDVEHFFMCFLAICISSFEKALLKSSYSWLLIFWKIISISLEVREVRLLPES
jgi:hypothetical protein